MARKRTESVRASERPASEPAAPATEAVVAGPVNLEDEIRRRAYARFLERGGAPGDPVADWLEAEREVLAKLRGASAYLAKLRAGGGGTAVEPPQVLADRNSRVAEGRSPQAATREA